MTLKVCISIEALKTDVRWNMRTWKKGTGYNFFVIRRFSDFCMCNSATFRRVSNDQITLLPCKWCNGHKSYDTKYLFSWCGNNNNNNNVYFLSDRGIIDNTIIHSQQFCQVFSLFGVVLIQQSLEERHSRPLVAFSGRNIYNKSFRVSHTHQMIGFT